MSKPNKSGRSSISVIQDEGKWTDNCVVPVEHGKIEESALQQILHQCERIEGKLGTNELTVRKDVNKEINDWKTKKEVPSGILGCDAQVEFQPDHESSIGCGLRGDKNKNI